MWEGLWRVKQSEKGAPGSNASDADIERYEEKKERASATSMVHQFSVNV